LSSKSHPSINITGSNNDHKDDASSTIVGVPLYRYFGAGKNNAKMTISKRNFNPSMLLKTKTRLISTLVVTLVVTTYSSRYVHEAPYTTGSDVTIPLLRGGMSLPPSHAYSSSSTPPYFLDNLSFLITPESTSERRILQQEIIDDNNSNDNSTTTTLDSSSSIPSCACKLEYCQESFHVDALCPSQSYVSGLHLGIQCLLLIILLAFSALFSGLTLGLMSLDLTGLEIVMAGDDLDAAKYAKNIYPVRKKGNLLLCTLLLGNVAVNSLMAIFSAEIFDGTVGFILSTFLIVIFGEIIPQALCSRYALRIGSATIPVVKVIRLCFLIIAWPLAKGLDLMLGRELATTYSNAEMIELLNVHVKENIIDQEEANAMAGALTYKNICVKDAMTAMEQTYMLGVDEKLSFDMIGKIFKTGYSRIPIFEISRNNIIGLLFVKDLIFLDPEDNVPIRSFIQIFGRNVHLVWPDDTLGDVLTELKKGKSHIGNIKEYTVSSSNSFCCCCCYCC